MGVAIANAWFLLENKLHFYYVRNDNISSSFRDLAEAVSAFGYMVWDCAVIERLSSRMILDSLLDSA